MPISMAISIPGYAGNVFEPRALDELIPDWKKKGAPVASPVTEDSFSILTETGAYKIPNFLLPSQLVGKKHTYDTISKDSVSND